jgi:hypothetical protein
MAEEPTARERKATLTAELRRIYAKHRDRDLPPDIWRHWLHLERQLDAVEAQISREAALEAAQPGNRSGARGRTLSR